MEDLERMERHIEAGREASRRIAEKLDQCFFTLFRLYQGSGQLPAEAAASAIRQINVGVFGRHV